MMTHAYSKLYLDDAMTGLGGMMDYAVYCLGYDAAEFYRLFLACPISRKIEEGHPKYVGGKSGAELALEVSGKHRPEDVYIQGLPGREYWAGWALAYLQWYTALSFRYIDNHGLPIETVLSLYNPLHEADITVWLDRAIGRLRSWVESHPAPLAEYRRTKGLSQERLSELSGVSLRMIRAYEQRKQDIGRAESRTVINLSKVLNCRPEDLVPFTF